MLILLRSSPYGWIYIVIDNRYNFPALYVCVRHNLHVLSAALFVQPGLIVKSMITCLIELARRQYFKSNFDSNSKCTCKQYAQHPTRLLDAQHITCAHDAGIGRWHSWLNKRIFTIVIRRRFLIKIPLQWRRLENTFIVYGT